VNGGLRKIADWSGEQGSRRAGAGRGKFEDREMFGFGLAFSNRVFQGCFKGFETWIIVLFLLGGVELC
jgi:hypothetical protein